MFGWLKKETRCLGSVLFQGSIPPRAEEFSFLRASGIRLEHEPDNARAHWALRLDHEEWGQALLVCLKNVPPPHWTLIAHSAFLSPAEKEEAARGETSITVNIEGEQGHVLRDRKRLLRFLRAVMGRDGVAAVDHLSTHFWSREALDDELCHDADLDITGIFALHTVIRREEGPCEWLHSHGLAAIGARDFDIVRPGPELFGRGQDALRAIAFAVVEGKISRANADFRLAYPNVRVQFVDVGEFNRRAAPEDVQLRDPLDEEHNRNRYVLCDPPARWWGKWLNRPRPSRFLSEDMAEEGMFHFSTEATLLMAERARGTYPALRRMAGEFAEFGFPVLVKVGYPTDHGGAESAEHLWCSVDRFHEDSVEATLENEPFDIAAMKKGDRMVHDLARLTDWLIITPGDSVNPRSFATARLVRERKEELRKHLVRNSG